MKKIFLYSLAALATLGFASCNGDYDDWASPQSYSPEDAAAKYGVTFAPGAEANDTYAAEEQGDGDVALVNISSDNSLVSGFTLKSLTVNGTKLDGTMNGNTVYVNASSLEKLVCQQYDSRASIARDMKVKVTASINLTNGDAVVGGSGDIEGSFTPRATPAIDEQGYYMLGEINGNGWDAKNPVWMNKVRDGVYQLLVTTTADKNYFKFYAGSHFVSGDWDEINKGVLCSAVDGDASTHGFAYYTGDPWLGGMAPQSAVISGAGTYLVTLDVNNLTYTVGKPVIYMAGNVNGWKQIDYLSSTDGNYFVGYMYLDQGGFKFCTQQDWNGTNYGADFSTDANAANITMTEPEGYYKVEVNIAEKKYTLTAITTIGIIGDATQGGWNESTPMTYNKEDRAWEIKNVSLTAGELKFRANDGWDINWGGTADALVQGGPNLKITDAGTYDIKLYAWADGYAKCELTKK